MTIKSKLTITILELMGVILILFLISMKANAVDSDNDTTLDFNWTVATGDVDHYNVYIYMLVDDEYILDRVETTENADPAEPGIFEYAVKNCSAGTYKITVEAVDAAGNVGPMSPESEPVICDPIEPAADLQASLSGDAVLLTWTASADAVSYNVYRDTKPDFTPDKTTGSNRIAIGVNDEDAETAGVQWTDSDDGVVGNPDLNYFYAVTAVNSLGKESDPSNKVGEFDIQLFADAELSVAELFDGAGNLISLPLTPSQPYTSHNLMGKIPNCTAIGRFAAEAEPQSWEFAYRDGDEVSGVNFPIVEGEGYLVKVTSDTVYTFTGDVITTAVTLELKEGKNLIGIPYATKPYTSYTLIPAIPDCTRVKRYDMRTTSWKSASLRSGRVFGDNFDIKAGEGYYVYTQDTSWTPASPAAFITAPEQTKLYQNYPNPFNPETWIPFQIAKASEVNIRIYNATGQLVRTIQLGYKQPGVYIKKSRAAYWDGRNDIGEKLANGLYFYELRTETFQNIRKMILLK